MTNLDQEIEVQNSLYPQKGGYEELLKDSYRYEALRPYRPFDYKNNIASYPVFDGGLNLCVPKIDLATGQQLYISFDDVLSTSYDDIRLLRYSTVQALNLELKPDSQKALNKRFSGDEDIFISVSELNDDELIQALNTLADLNTPINPAFDDEAFACSFKQLESYLNFFNIQLVPSDFVDQSLTLSPDSQRQLLCGNQSTCAQSRNFRFDDRYFGVDYKQEHSSTVAFAKMPIPVLFRTENNFLKAGAHILAKHVFLGFTDESNALIHISDGRDFLYHHQDKSSTQSLTTGLAGCMFAAHLGSPITNNDLNWFNSYSFSNDEFKTAIKIATKVSNFLSKLYTGDYDFSINGDLWQNWKIAYKNLELQHATPTLFEISSRQKLDKKEILQCIQQIISDKCNNLKSQQYCQAKSATKDL